MSVHFTTLMGILTELDAQFTTETVQNTKIQKLHQWQKPTVQGHCENLNHNDKLK